MLEQSLAQRRFVSITGAGGIGKTSVASMVASRLAHIYADGICFVDLASLASQSLVPSAVASVLRLEVSTADPLADLIVSLRSRHLLLVLDNCEHLLETVAPLAARILAEAPGVRILP